MPVQVMPDCDFSRLSSCKSSTSMFPSPLWFWTWIDRIDRMRKMAEQRVGDGA